jgi:murein DD-endopeptidase MepM/ murein hydrolase activator NlpD
MWSVVALTVLFVPHYTGAEEAQRQDSAEGFVMAIPDWPTVFELNSGESCTVRRQVNGKLIERDVKLLDVQEYWEPDFFTGAGDSRTLRLADVTVEVNGVRATLKCRPYQMPVPVKGLRIYVETTRRWAQDAEIERMTEMDADVRLSAVAEGEGWGPSDFAFPVQDYRWRSSSYFNTWNSLVPYNKLYYHRGEDFGAIPDCLPVVCALPGKIVQSPLPNGDGDSNGLIIETEAGIRVQYYHMNAESITTSAVAGARMTVGASLGKTGMTWDGRRSQTNDPHLHFGLSFHDTAISAFPAIVESYFRAYPDRLIAIAGGYHFAEPDQIVLLDGSRSQARPDETITSYEWRLHDGRRIHEATAQITYLAPGLYCEELIVRTANGAEARDYAQVRVYDRKRGRNMVAGWVYHHPTRGIKPGQPVTFWNRLSGAHSDVRVDFGDGTPVEIIHENLSHAFPSPGLYTVSFVTSGPEDEPAMAKMCVLIEPAGEH